MKFRLLVSQEYISDISRTLTKNTFKKLTRKKPVTTEIFGKYDCLDLFLNSGNEFKKLKIY